MSNRWSSWKSVIETFALVVIAGAVAWTAITGRAAVPVARAAARAARPAPPLPMEPISLAGAQTSGSATAKVALVVYSDFQCPFCGKFARESLPTLEKEYVQTGKVLLAFRQFPLPIHPFAEKAAEASLCAGRQGKFWAFHDDLFANQQPLDTDSLRGRAQHLGLQPGQFSACLEGETTAAVQADRAGGGPLGVVGTPTFLAGRISSDGRLKVSERFSGAQPLAQFKSVLDRLVATATAASAPGHQ